MIIANPSQILHILGGFIGDSRLHNQSAKSQRTEHGQVVYLMRGLPSCGKSTTAKQLAGDEGVILETDQYFYSEVGNDPKQYDYDGSRLAEARSWNLNRFRDALFASVTPIVVDRGNGRNPETREYVELAQEFGYQVELCEPDSPWWQELRVLLKYKKFVASELLDRWAEALAERSQETHRVPVATIRHWMESWKSDLTVDEILKYQQASEKANPDS